MNEQSTLEQLMLLKGMTVRAGVIHEAQRLQLEMWPRLSKKISSCVPKIDMEKKLVILDCKAKSYRTDAFERQLFDNILIWVRSILWDETKVVIRVNRKVVFNSDKR